MADKTQNVKTRLSFDGEAEYKAACKEINSTLKMLNSEMKLVTAEYKDNASSVDALKAKQAVLQKTYDEQAKKVKETEAALVVRWDLPQRDMYIAVLKGTPSAKPTATAVTRTTEIWELALADIYVGKGVTRIQTQNITDQRFNSAVCGIVTGTVEEIDASVLTKQFTDFFNTYSAAVLDEFSAYKQSMEKYLTQQ